MWKNYFNMFKARGMRLVIEYFLYNHCFDLINKTDTHLLDDSLYKDSDSSNEIYMATWAKDIVKATRKLMEFLSEDISKFSLIDLGSGKGKILLVWRKMFPKAKITGIELDKNLIEICLENINLMNYSNINVIASDAAQCKLDPGKKIIAMNNPFGEDVIKSFFENHIADDIYIIYFNPVMTNCIEKLGFRVLFSHETYRGGSSFKVFGRNYKKSSQNI